MTQTAQPTAGPWEAFEILDGIAIKDSRNVTIALCHYVTEADAIEVSEGETEANAHLIKAAPDLLEACEEGLAFVAGDDPLDRRAWEQMAATFRAALAKAEATG